MTWKSADGIGGNIFAVLFGAVVMLGLMGAGLNMLLQGPVQSMSRVTYYNMAENDIIAATALLSEASLALTAADCDADGMIEPLPFALSAGAPAPAGGGHIPAMIGARKGDPWQTLYGYCVWDNGGKVHDASCGGATANRLAGGDTEEAYAIAIISAGPDKIFQTTCNEWTDTPAGQVSKLAGSDDLVRFIPYGQFLLPSKAKAQLEDLPDEACMSQTLGTLRMHMGTVQACMDTGWTEVGTAAQTDSNFIEVTNAILSHEYTSNAITFSGFFGEKVITVEGGAVLLVNGSVASAPSKVKAGDTIALRASAASVPEVARAFSISVSGVKKTWQIISRNKTPASLTITPSAATMNVVGPGSPAYSTPVGFIVRNMGEAPTLQLSPSTLSPTSNYEFISDVTYVGDGCGGKILTHNQDCFVDVRSKSSSESIPNGSLTVTDGTSSAIASLNGTASGWTCTMPWGVTVPDGGTATGYAIAGTCGGTCATGIRTCTSGIIGGNVSYSSGTCDNTSMCTYSWYSGGFGSCNAACGSTGTQTRTVYCRRQDNVQVADSFCSGAGSKPLATQSCSGAACYSYSWYTGSWGGCPSNCTATSELRTVYCRRSDNTQVSDSYCSGSKPSGSSPCNRTTCCAAYTKRCTPYPSSHICSGSCGGHYVYGTTTWCADTWTGSECPSGCSSVMSGLYNAYCVPR